MTRSNDLLSAALLSAALAALLIAPFGLDAHSGRHQDDAPRILLDQSPRAVEYQLARLSNEQLTRVERKDNDVRYRPVYQAILTRNGLARAFRDEALAALVRMDKTGAPQVLLDVLARVRPADLQAADTLLDMLLGQPADTLRQHRDVLAQAVTGGNPLVLRGAYGAMMIADGDPGRAWEAATKNEGHLVELLRSVRHLGKADDLRATLFKPIATLLEQTRDPAIRVEALAALGWTRRDAVTFELLAQEVLRGADAAARAAAVRSLQLVPERVWPAGQIEPVARALVALVRETAPDQRTEPSVIEAAQLGERLAAALPEASGRTVRRELRALGVQVVRIEAVPEQLVFDLKWFAAEAGKPVQIVLFNPDAMPHNLVISKPGSLREVGMAGSTMAPPSDPEVKPYVPDSPLVLQATRLLNEGETDRLNFTAPTEPGEYPFLCTFPGHWLRMYGVMLVVENLEEWEAKRTVPTDPTTNKPFGSQRN